jgi:hypothetical protein
MEDDFQAMRDLGIPVPDDTDTAALEICYGCQHAFTPGPETLEITRMQSGERVGLLCATCVGAIATYLDAQGPDAL